MIEMHVSGNMNEKSSIIRLVADSEMSINACFSWDAVQYGILSEDSEVDWSCCTLLLQDYDVRIDHSETSGPGILLFVHACKLYQLEDGFKTKSVPLYWFVNLHELYELRGGSALYNRLLSAFPVLSNLVQQLSSRDNCDSECRNTSDLTANSIPFSQLLVQMGAASENDCADDGCQPFTSGCYPSQCEADEPAFTSAQRGTRCAMASTTSAISSSCGHFAAASSLSFQCACLQRQHKALIVDSVHLSISAEHQEILDSIQEWASEYVPLPSDADPNSNSRQLPSANSGSEKSQSAGAVQSMVLNQSPAKQSCSQCIQVDLDVPPRYPSKANVADAAVEVGESLLACSRDFPLALQNRERRLQEVRQPLLAIEEARDGSEEDLPSINLSYDERRKIDPGSDDINDPLEQLAQTLPCSVESASLEEESQVFTQRSEDLPSEDDVGETCNPIHSTQVDRTNAVVKSYELFDIPLSCIPSSPVLLKSDLLSQQKQRVSDREEPVAQLDEPKTSETSPVSSHVPSAVTAKENLPSEDGIDEICNPIHSTQVDHAYAVVKSTELFDIPLSCIQSSPAVLLKSDLLSQPKQRVSDREEPVVQCDELMTSETSTVSLHVSSAVTAKVTPAGSTSRTVSRGDVDVVGTLQPAAGIGYNKENCVNAVYSDSDQVLGSSFVECHWTAVDSAERGGPVSDAYSSTEITLVKPSNEMPVNVDKLAACFTVNDVRSVDECSQTHRLWSKAEQSQPSQATRSSLRLRTGSQANRTPKHAVKPGHDIETAPPGGEKARKTSAVTDHRSLVPLLGGKERHQTKSSGKESKVLFSSPGLAKKSFAGGKRKMFRQHMLTNSPDLSPAKRSPSVASSCSTAESKLGRGGGGTTSASANSPFRCASTDQFVSLKSEPVNTADRSCSPRDSVPLNLQVLCGSCDSVASVSSGGSVAVLAARPLPSRTVTASVTHSTNYLDVVIKTEPAAFVLADLEHCELITITPRPSEEGLDVLDGLLASTANHRSPLANSETLTAVSSSSMEVLDSIATQASNSLQPISASENVGDRRKLDSPSHMWMFPPHSDDSRPRKSRTSSPLDVNMRDAAVTVHEVVTTSLTCKTSQDDCSVISQPVSLMSSPDCSVAPVVQLTSSDATTVIPCKVAETAANSETTVEEQCERSLVVASTSPSSVPSTNSTSDVLLNRLPRSSSSPSASASSFAVQSIENRQTLSTPKNSLPSHQPEVVVASGSEREMADKFNMFSGTNAIGSHSETCRTDLNQVLEPQTQERLNVGHIQEILGLNTLTVEQCSVYNYRPSSSAGRFMFDYFKNL